MTAPVGALVNAGAIALGAAIGAAAGSVIPAKLRESLFQALGLCTMLIGLKMALAADDFMPVLLSVVLGVLTGEALGLADRFNRGGERLKSLIRSKNEKFTDGLVLATVMFCAGAMGIVGSFEEGLGGGAATLFSKSVIDFCAAVMLASVYGAGVGASAIPLLLYQGSLTLLAGVLAPYLTEGVKVSLVSVGGLLIVGIGFNLVGLKPISISNLLPALGYAVVLGALMS
ncbi:MAG: DUF554 domain-containing protein [Candidatus Adiutrix sp.]|jgi:uncharacterized membrane protein YqgA involved in biofilm formation|nr:DUF554 domain-containing protein [Candidatus Adiutrix sp.]